MISSFLHKMFKMGKAPLYGGHFLMILNFGYLYILASGEKVIRELFVNPHPSSPYPAIYGYQRPWAYICDIYGIPPPTPPRTPQHRRGYTLMEYPRIIPKNTLLKLSTVN